MKALADAADVSESTLPRHGRPAVGDRSVSWHGRGHPRSRPRQVCSTAPEDAAEGEARSAAEGRDPYPEGCTDTADRDNDDCRCAVSDLEMQAEPFGAEDLVSAVMQRRRTLLDRRSAEPPTGLAVRREMLRQPARQDVFGHFYLPGSGAVSASPWTQPMIGAYPWSPLPASEQARRRAHTPV